MRAIVFDFFGTLTDPAAEVGRLDTFAATAAALGAPVDRFCAAMVGAFPERITGVHGDTRATLREMARRCGIEPSDRRLDDAVAAQHRGAELMRRPRSGALSVLDTLRARGFLLGVLSDCSSELCEGWPATAFAARIDAAVFSWREGYRKPDTRLYATVAARLAVPASACWYVGDGGSRELQGARSAGMRPVLLTNAGHPGASVYRDDPDTYRPELRIADIVDVLDLVEAPAPAEESGAAVE